MQLTCCCCSSWHVSAGEDTLFLGAKSRIGAPCCETRLTFWRDRQRKKDRQNANNMVVKRDKLPHSIKGVCSINPVGWATSSLRVVSWEFVAVEDLRDPLGVNCLGVSSEGSESRFLDESSCAYCVSSTMLKIYFNGQWWFMWRIICGRIVLRLGNISVIFFFFNKLQGIDKNFWFNLLRCGTFEGCGTFLLRRIKYLTTRMVSNVKMCSSPHYTALTELIRVPKPHQTTVWCRQTFWYRERPKEKRNSIMERKRSLHTSLYKKGIMSGREESLYITCCFSFWRSRC